MEKNLEYYKARFNKAVNEGLVDYPKGEKASGELISRVFSGKAKYDRLVAMLSLAKEILPAGIIDPLAEKLDDRDFSQLPFKESEFKLGEKLGEGYVSKVHLLESQLPKQPSLELKLFMNDQRLNTDELVSLAGQWNKDCENIRKHYSDLPDLVPQEMTFLTTDKKSKTPTIATIQSFLGRNLIDVFGLKRDDLIRHLAEDENLRQEFSEFVSITQKLQEEDDLVVDLLGEKNLVIVENGEKKALRFLDPHQISSPSSPNEVRNKRIREAIDFLSEAKEGVLETVI